MSTPANPGFHSVAENVAAPAVSYTAIPTARLFFWSVRREIWEHRSIIVVPIAAAALAIFGSFFALGHLATRGSVADFARSLDFSALLIMGLTLLVAIFYSSEALYTERRDRSSLFWKSLPVSDRLTVLSKAAIPILVLPLLTFAATVLVQGIVASLGAMIAAGTGHLADFTGQIHLFRMWSVLLFHLLAIHGLWYAPFYAWFLMVSAWARRAPFLWAVLPPAALFIFEKIAFNSWHLAHLVGSHFSGGGHDHSPSGDPNSLAAMTPSLADFLSTPGLWIGLAFTALFLAVAIWLRRNRESL